MAEVKEQEKILDKIQKLMAKQKSAEEVGNIEEAAAFASKVTELLSKHNLSSFDIKGPKEKSPIKDKYFEGLKNPKNEGKWIYQLYSSLCKVNNCKMVIMTGPAIRRGKIVQVEDGAVLFGEPENIEVVVFLADQLESKIRYLASKAWKIAKKDPREKRNRFLRSYFTACVAAIYTKLQQAEEQRAKMNSNVTALAVCRKEQLEKAVSEKFNNLKPSRRSGGNKGSIGTAMGLKDGRNIEINKGLSGSNNGPKNIE